MPAWMKTGLWIIALGMLGMSAACTPRTDLPAPTASRMPAGDSLDNSPTPTEIFQETPTSETPSPLPTPLNQLDAAGTFEVIAAVHANILQVEGWLPRGFSFFERQAIARPIVEISTAPMEDIFAKYVPHSALASQWQQAALIFLEFSPQLMAWVDGEVEDTAFTHTLAGLSSRSGALIVEAEAAASQLGVETGQYGPDYALAADVVFRLNPKIEPYQQGWEAAQREGAIRQETSELVVRQLNPFVHPFAGSDVFMAVGLLENTAVQAQESVEIEIRFYNFLHEHLGTLAGRLSANIALPGKVYPFSASVVTEGEEAALKDWVDYEVTVFSHPFEPVGSVFQDFDFSVSSAEADSSGSYLLEGTLTNLADEAFQAEDIRIAAMAFDADGVLVGVGTGGVLTMDMLSPGAEAPFQVVIDALSGEPASYQFFAEVIPED